jgi:hypothetical protein
MSQRANTSRTLPLDHGGRLLYRIGDGLTHRYDLRGDAGDADVAVAGRFNLIVVAVPTKG